MSAKRPEDGLLEVHDRILVLKENLKNGSNNHLQTEMNTLQDVVKTLERMLESRRMRQRNASEWSRNGSGIADILLREGST